MEITSSSLSYLDVIPWTAIDEKLAHRLQSVTAVEILLATPIGMGCLLENVYEEMEKRLPLAARRGVLRCSAIAGPPDDWCVCHRSFACTDVAHSNSGHV